MHSYESLSLRKKQNKLIYWASLYMLCYNNVKNLNNSISGKQHNVNLSFLKKKHLNNNTISLSPVLDSSFLGYMVGVLGIDPGPCMNHLYH